MITTVLDTGASTPDCLASLSGFAYGFRINGYCAVNSVAADRLGNLSFTVYGGDDVLEISTYFAILKVSPAGIVTTVGPAAEAQISYVNSLAVDGAGNLFIADGIRIRKVSADGIIATVAGNGGYGRYSGDGGPATAAVLSSPRGVTVDGQGNLFTLEQDRIRRISPSGIITTVAVLGPCDYSSGNSAAIGAQLLCRAGGIAADLAGNLFIADSFSIRKLSPDGTITTVAGNNTRGFSGDGGPATDAQLSSGLTVGVDRGGNLFIGDPGNSRLRKVSPDGIITTIAGNGTSGFSGDGGRATSAQLDGPGGIAVDGAGNVFIGDGRRIRKISPNGIISSVAGNGSRFWGYSGDGGPATSANGVSGPLALDGAGNLFVAVLPWSAFGCYVRKISADGIITSVAGSYPGGYSGDGGPSTEAKLKCEGNNNGNSLIAADMAGNVYVADTFNNAIRILRPINGPF